MAKHKIIEPEVQLTFKLSEFEALVRVVSGQGEMDGAWYTIRDARTELMEKRLLHD